MSHGQPAYPLNAPVLPLTRSISKIVGTAATVLASPSGKRYLVLMSDKGGFNVRPGRCVASTVSAVNTTTDALSVTGHGMRTGFGPYRLSATTTFPTGTDGSTDYYVIYVDANTIKLATTRDRAAQGIAVDLTGAGSGTITLKDQYNVSATEFPAATISDGSGSVYIPDKATLVLPTVEEVTVLGYALDSVLSYYWI